MMLLFLACDAPLATDDTGGDTDTDTDSDTDSDTDTDTDVDVWPWCPSADSAINDPAWGTTIEAGSGAVYCVVPDEGRSLAENLAMKAMVRVVEGSYPLPTIDGSYPVHLPACVGFADGTGSATGAAAEATAAVSTYDAVNYLYVDWSAPMGEWTLQNTASLTGAEGVYAPLVLDGDPADVESAFALQLHPLGGPSSETRRFDTCHTSAWNNHTFDVAFEGGSVTLAVQIGYSDAGTQPSTFVHASGELDGVTWEQGSYWSLVYQPEHHHFAGHYAVLLPVEVGPCALRVDGLGSTVPADTTVSLTGCDLEPTESRVVSEIVHDVE